MVANPKPRCIVDGKAIMGKVGLTPFSKDTTLPYCKGKHTAKEITNAVAEIARKERASG